MNGADVKAIRDKMGLNQKEFGQLLGYSRFAVLDWEKNRFAPPRDLMDKVTAAKPETLATKPGSSAHARQIADWYAEQRKAGRNHNDIAMDMSNAPGMTNEAWQLIGKEWDV